MLNFKQGNLLRQTWGSQDIILIPANGVVGSTSKLVMGAGFAKAIRDSFPELDTLFGTRLKEAYPKHSSPYLYYLLLEPGWMVGLFQTKRDWKSPARLDIIRTSIFHLNLFTKDNPEFRIHLPYPGIGNGRLSKGEVSPLLDKLTGNVTIWEL